MTQTMLFDVPSESDNLIPPPPPAPTKKKTSKWLIVGAVFAGLWAIGTLSGDDDSSSASYDPPTRTSSTSVSSSYSTASFERDYVEDSCRTALSMDSGGGYTIGDGLASGMVSPYQMASAFADGYVPNADAGVLSRSEVISACVEGLGG